MNLFTESFIGLSGYFMELLLPEISFCMKEMREPVKVSGFV